MRTLLWLLGGVIGAMEAVVATAVLLMWGDAIFFLGPIALFTSPVGALTGMVISRNMLIDGDSVDVGLWLPLFFAASLFGFLFSIFPLALLSRFSPAISSAIFFAQLFCLAFVCKLIQAQRNAS